MTDPNRKHSMNVSVQVFLSYAREDETKVVDLYHRLSTAGFKPWMDKKDILPGERWEASITRAIRDSHFFLACLSPNSTNKRGVIQKEIRDALDIMDSMLPSDIYLIPVRLEACEVPDRLRKFQWVNLFEGDGWSQLDKAIRVGMRRRPIQSSLTSESGLMSMATDIHLATVTLLLDVSFRNFNQSEQNKLIHELARLVNIDSSQVRILRIISGSVQVVIEMPGEAIKQLLARYSANEPVLRALRILGIKSEISVASLTEQRFRAGDENVERWLKEAGWLRQPFAKEDNLTQAVLYAEDEEEHLNEYGVLDPLEMKWPDEVKSITLGAEALNALLRPEHAVIFAPAGAGKSCMELLVKKELSRTKSYLIAEYLDLPTHPISHVEHAEAIVRNIQAILPAELEMKFSSDDPFTKLQNLIGMAKENNYRGIQILVNRIDVEKGESSLKEKEEIIQNLFAPKLLRINHFAIKMFLPAELASQLKRYDRLPQHRIFSISWNERSLCKYITERIQSVAGIKGGLEMVSDDGKGNPFPLDDEVVKQISKSPIPRSVNLLTTEMIWQHAIRQTEAGNFRLTRDDLRMAAERLRFYEADGQPIPIGISAGGGVIGRDKVAAGGHVITAGDNATVIVGAFPASKEAPKTKGATSKHPIRKARPKIGIITALEKEFAAVASLLINSKEYVVSGPGAGRRYLLGEIPAKKGGRHLVVLALADMGTNNAAIRASLLLEHFPSIEAVVMVGIAGGIPNPKKPEEHVRLGDIVVSNQKGITQYDFVKETMSETIHRHPPRPPSPKLLEGVRLLKTAEMKGKHPWLRFVRQATSRLRISRPPESSDVLVSATNPKKRIPHPRDPRREKGQPRVFIGPIASSNTLLTNPHKRDKLRDQFGVKAVEMEASGIADASWNHEVGYLVIRGICDYCAPNKNDVWQDYAAMIAAAYTRALLESIPSVGSAKGKSMQRKQSR
jgi:nucleoside phosphorylase